MRKVIFILLIVVSFLSISQNVGISDDNSLPVSFFHLHSQNYTSGSPLFQITNNTSNSLDSSYGFNINFDNYFNTNFVNNYQNDSAGISFFTKDNSTNTLLQRMTVANDGNVGIGTKYPTNIFHVKSSNNSLLEMNDGVNNNFSIPLTLYHNVNGIGVGANGIGTGLFFANETTTNDISQVTGAVGSSAIDATQGSVDGDLQFYIAKDDVLTKVADIQQEGTNTVMNFDDTTKITNVATPVNGMDAVNKNYVDALIGSSLGGSLRDSTFTVSGSPYTFVVPTGVNIIYVTAIGAGGGGGGSGTGAGSNGYISAGGGGGSGELYKNYLVRVIPGETITVTVGAKGTGGVPGTSGTDGGDSSFGTYLLAKKGWKGITGNYSTTANAQVGGSGGRGGGFSAHYGGNGAATSVSASNGEMATIYTCDYFPGSSGGGGGYDDCTSHNGSGGNFLFYEGGGNFATCCYCGGGGGASYFGNGGKGGAPSADGITVLSTAYGAGGGGGGCRDSWSNTEYSGGDGADGIIIILY